MSIQKQFTLKSGGAIPSLGFGTWGLKGELAIKALETALATGYRHIDTADAYENHIEVRKGIENSGIPREEIFLTTKVWRTDLAKQDVLDSVTRFLEELDTDYIDLLLIHWPNNEIQILETLEAFGQLKEQNKIKHIGVSNFSIKKLEEALATNIEIECNQIELHPMLNQQELHNYCKEKGILVTAYSPLGRGEILNNEVLKEIAQKYNKTVAQIVLNWILSREMATIPKASTKEHIEENFKALEFELESEDIQKISLLGTESMRMVNPAYAEWN